MHVVCSRCMTLLHKLHSAIAPVCGESYTWMDKMWHDSLSYYQKMQADAVLMQKKMQIICNIIFALMVSLLQNWDIKF